MSDPHSPRPPAAEHAVYPGGPACQPNCPGPWSSYHDGYADGYENAEAAIRSAGTPPASRDVDDRLVRSLTKWLQQSGWVRRHELARAESEAFANTFANAFPFAATPPEPVGGREALLQTALDELLALYPLAFCVLDRFETCGDPFCVEARTNRDAILARLQASPPTGVSETGALDVERLASVMRSLDARLLPGEAEGYAVLVVERYAVLAREQADSEDGA